MSVTGDMPHLRDNASMTGLRATATGHAMLPELSHDELAEQMFVLDLKMYLGGDVEKAHKKTALSLAQKAWSSGRNDVLPEVMDGLFERSGFQTWVALRREAQNTMWQSVAQSADRQHDRLKAIAEVAEPLGSVTIDPDFVVPDYLDGEDVHLMPGGYAGSRGDEGVLQGAVIDLGGAVFMRGMNGGLLNDRRGQSAMSHVLTCYPELEPKRILEMGCGIGASLVPAAVAFPDAEVFGVDVGASMLRYAHARAEHLGVKVHFSQQNAESTNFPDASFDLVYSCVALHEASMPAVVNMLAESRRLLRPGGVAVHLEVPLVYGDEDIWSGVQAEIETVYNNEPNWIGALTADYDRLMRDAGFDEPLIGYQTAVGDARGDKGAFSDVSQGPFRSWLVVSAKVPLGA